MKTFNISDYNLQQIILIKHDCENFISRYTDGHVYICKVRSYGRNWKEWIGNEYTLQELCYRYSGDDGIVDVYSTHPDLSHIENYGQVMYIKSQEDYENWHYYNLLVKEIEDFEKEWAEWDNRDNVPFRERPMWEPYCTKAELEILKKQLADYDMSFVPPVPYKPHTEEESD